MDAMDESAAAEADELTRLRIENTRLRQQLELGRTAHRHLEMLAHRFSGEDAALDNADQIHAFCQRIAHSIEMLVQEFKELLSGRKSFQKDFGLDLANAPGDAESHTRLWRLDELHGDLGRRLFDWRTPSIDDESFKELKSAIDELKYHHLALLAGYERSSREGTLEIIKPLDPDVIQAEVVGKQGDGVGAALRRLNPFLNSHLWREYRRRYQELVGEDSRRFESMFRPLFRLGYREAMRAMTMSRQADQRSSAKEDR